MSRSRRPKCRLGRGCGVCGKPASGDLHEQRDDVEEQEAEEESLEVGDKYPFYCCDECGV